MDRRPTIIDVARKANVSKSTVSLVLQNSPMVREETRVEVRKAMAELGYVYNRAAATLRSSSAGLIGLVINDLRNPFFTEFATSVQMALSSRGFATVIANTDEDPAIQAQVVSAMIEHGVSAIVISPVYGEEENAFGAVARAGIPVMQVLRRVVADTRAVPFAAPDYEKGSRIAVEHLIATGAKRIAFVGGLEGRAVTAERMSGYTSVLVRTGMEPLVMTGRATRAFGREAAHRLAKDHPEIDAAICFNDLVALGLLAGSAEIGRRIGEDLKVVGFDDIEDCRHAWPSLTSVRCDIDHFGKGIAETVLAWLEKNEHPAPETRTEVTLSVRNSSWSQA